MVLRPFDEIGDDQEIAGKTHPLDDLQLKIEAFLVFVDTSCMRDHGKPRLQPFI